MCSRAPPPGLAIFILTGAYWIVNGTPLVLTSVPVKASAVVLIWIAAAGTGHVPAAQLSEATAASF